MGLGFGMAIAALGSNFGPGAGGSAVRGNHKKYVFLKVRSENFHFALKKNCAMPLIIHFCKSRVPFNARNESFV